MGLKCKIIKNKDGVVQKVSAPNGNDSILYKDAMNKHNSQKTALHTWATAYTDNFNLYYGDWQNSPSEDQSLDANGEPVLSDVESYLDNIKGIAPPLTDMDILGLRSLMISNGIQNIEELDQAIGNFIVNGKIEINRRNLKKSGLYSQDEINRIMRDGIARRNLTDLFNRFNSVVIGEPSARTNYMLSSDIDSDISYISDAYTLSGKKDFINPEKLENDLLEALGGIKDRMDFDRAVFNLPYDSIIERYQSDAEYAESLFDHYSAYDRVNVVDSGGDMVTDSAAPALSSYSVYNEKAASELIADLSALTAVDPEIWNDAELIKEGLRRVTANAAKMGIDLADLEDSYDAKGQGEIEDFLLGLDTYVRSLAPGREPNTSFYEDYDSFFSLGSPVTRPVILNESEKNLSRIVVRDNTGTTYNDIQLYENFGLIHLRGNIFLKIDKKNRSELYDVAYQFNDAYEKLFKMPMFPIGDSAGKSREEVISMIKEWANKKSSSRQSDEMVVFKKIYNLDTDPAPSTVDVQRELNRYMERQKHEPVSPYDNIRLRNLILKEKIASSDLYNKVLSSIVFDPGSFSLHLTNNGPMSIREIELSTSGELRDLLLRSALHSNDASLGNLFYIQDYPDIYRNANFYRDLYTRHPELTPEINVNYQTLEDGRIKTYFSGDFVNVNNVLMEKIAEDGGMSVFEEIASMRESSMDYFGGPRILKSDAYVLSTYDNPSPGGGTNFISKGDLVKESVIEKTMEKRSC